MEEQDQCQSSVDVERRVSGRWEPQDFQDEVQLRIEGELVPGIVSNVSEGGLCVVVLSGDQLQTDQQIDVMLEGQWRSAIVRNLTTDAATEAYGLMWR